MKKVTVLLMSAMLALNSCFYTTTGSCIVMGYSEEGGDYTEERTDMGRFDKIDVKGPFNVHFVQSDTRKLVLEGTEESVKAVIAQVRDDELLLKLKDGKYSRMVLKVTVYAPSVTEMCSSGSGNLYDCDGHDEGNYDVEYVSNGSGDLYVRNLKCGDLEGETHGSGGLKISSVSCDDLEIESHGSGDVSLSDITVRGGIELSTHGSGSMRTERITNTESDADLHLSTSGSGSAGLDEVNIRGNMSLRTSGSGSISVNGSCNDVSASTHGSGSIHGNLKYNHLSQSRHGSGSVRL